MFSTLIYIFEDFGFVLFEFSKYLLGYFEYLFSPDENGADIRYFHLGAHSIFFCRPSYFFRLLFAFFYFFQQSLAFAQTKFLFLGALFAWSYFSYCISKVLRKNTCFAQN